MAKVEAQKTRFSELEAFLGKTPDADYTYITPGARPTATFPESREPTPAGPAEVVRVE